MQKMLLGLFSIVFGLSFFSTSVFAHAVVKPNTAGVGSYTDFSLGVPSEKDAATVQVKLLIPEGITSVTPIVKNGWTVEILNSAKQGRADDDGKSNPIPEAILWKGGSIPAHQKDFFVFSTQVPAVAMELDWKVEQTYSDGSIVSWTKSAQDQPKDEKGNPDFSKFGPFSKTMVVNDLQSSPKPVEVVSASGVERFSSSLSLIAFVLAVLSIFWQLQSRKKK